MTLEKIRRFSDDQYSNENRLDARIQIYNYCEKKLNWREWVFDRLDFGNVKRVLELGCGNGVLWKDNLKKIPKNIHIKLTDISEGMIEAARKTIGKHNGRFSFIAADAGKTPFENNAFQMVIANHMIYHVRNKEGVFSEIERLLADGGSAYVSTLSMANQQEFINAVVGFDKRLAFDSAGVVQSFNLENGEHVLSRRFNVLEKHYFQNDIVINSTEPLILYLASCHTPGQRDILINNYADFKAYLHTTINRTGKLRITNKSVLFRFVKKK